jgi:tetratricopeptide (TPR) repeat protein
MSAGSGQPSAAHCLRLGELCFGERRFAEAESWLRQAVARDPASAAAHRALGNTLRMRDDAAGAEAALRECIRLAPDDPQGYVALAFLYRGGNRLREAAGVMLANVDRHPQDSAAVQKAMSFFEDIHRLDLAERCASRILPQAGDDSAFLCRLGRLREKLGLFEEASACYRRALARDPGAGVASIGLATLAKFDSPDHPDARLVRAALAAAPPGSDGAICAHFALAKILDDCGDCEPAFAHLEIANSLRRRQCPFDAAAHRARMAAVRQAFGAAALAALPRARPRAPVPVFVVGMPRSGTTLVESVLAAHPQVFGAGELNELPAIAAALGVAADPGRIARVPATDLQDAAAHYLDFVAALSGGEAVVVDKNPANHEHLGLIALLFPHARIVHCRRDPMDTALSLYFQNFAHAATAWSYDLEAIADVYGEYRRLMRHWRENLPLALFDLRYEELVAEPERETRRLLDFLGLPFDPACLRHQEQRRAVGTASVWQVRQPLYRHAVGRWRRYARQLEPLRARLEQPG